MTAAPKIHANVSIATATELSQAELTALCEAAEDAIKRGGGFGWLDVPPRATLEAYWRGLMLVPGRHLYVAQLDGLMVGALQLHEASKNMESQAQIATVQSGFTASWARGYGIGRDLMIYAIDQARALGFRALKLDVRETQHTAINLYTKLGFVEWGRLPRYAYVEGQWIAGYHFYLDL